MLLKKLYGGTTPRARCNKRVVIQEETHAIVEPGHQPSEFFMIMRPYLLLKHKKGAPLPLSRCNSNRLAILDYVIRVEELSLIEDVLWVMRPL